ncbi:hypothetical protein [Bradyrhizobium canariense]|jgi:hypothetical protein|uniref:Porin n=1 Tax=Bradyrhizobium canariense TaxID=255045 RepID=A0A1H2BC86_9BRAD|nr:hypothetical protein [Bradyrhizobium canariense]SDT55910.1 hypothetical protein SAMN05444158_7028 [Bradyrhizobium canariense]
MSIPKQLGAAAVLTALSFTPAPAQQVMSEPAYCAFFYPYANCQNKGPGNPYTDPNYRRNGGLSSGPWPSGGTVGVAPKRPRSATTKYLR